VAGRVDGGSPGRLFVDRDPARMPLEALLPRAGAAVARHQQRVAAAHGVSPTALGVLGVLAGRNGLSHRDLAGCLGVSPATLTPVVDVLEQTGDVRRERDGEDRRIVRLVLTDAGAQRWTTTADAVARTAAAALPRPSTQDEALVRAYLTAVLAALDER